MFKFCISFLFFLYFFKFHQTIKTFLLENDGARIINEFNHTKNLSKSTRNKLFDLLVDFIFQRIGLYPSKDEKVAISKAVVELFPNLYALNSKLDGIVRNMNLFAKNVF